MARVLCLVYLALVFQIVTSGQYETFFMDRFASKIGRISLNIFTRPAVILKASESSSYRPVKMNAVALVTVPKGLNMIITVNYFNLPKVGTKCLDYIEFEGLSGHSDEEEMCGNQHEIPRVLTTLKQKNGNGLKVKFSTASRKEDFQDPANFEIVITAVKPDLEKNCQKPHNFFCENKLCISTNYKCDGHDNCGDESDENQNQCPERTVPPVEGKINDDETDGLSLFNLIIIISSSFVVLSLLAALIIYKCRKPASTPSELTRISTVEGQLQSSSSYTNPHDRGASGSPINPPYSPYYRNNSYQSYEGDPHGTIPEQSAPPPPYEEAVSTK